MRRWNGWGDESIGQQLPGSAVRFLEQLVGKGKPPHDVTLAQVVAQVPASRLPEHPLVTTEATERVRHARGQSLPDWIALRSGQMGAFPDGVAYPQTEDDVAALLAWAGEIGARVIPYGGGTSVVGHINPERGEQPVLTIDMRRMNRLRAFDEVSQLASFGVALDLVTHAEVWGLPASAVVIGGILGAHAYYTTAVGHLVIDRLVLKLPLVGQIAIKHNTVQLTRTLGTILAGGTPLVDALQGARSAVSNRFVSQELMAAVNDIREGATLAVALDRPKVLPRLAIEMLSVGEETGSLDTMLRDVAEFYEADLDTRLTQLTTWIEPALLLVMGILVGGIVIVMYLPVFQMAGTVSG